MTVLILTPLPLEYEAVSRHLTDKKSIVKEGAAYEIGRFKGRHHDYEVVVREPGMKNVDMALAAERAIQHWQPQIALLIGIAGGIKDLKIGDVAIAKSAFNYDSGKESDNGFLPRPVEYTFSEELLAYAQVVQRSDHWKKRTTDGASNASVLIASVAAGDKVVAAVNNSTFQRIEQFLSHTKFLEMEAAGFGLAIQRHRNIHALVIRGISDLCAGKGETDKGNWQVVAAERAAAVGFELLEALDCSSFIKVSLSEMELTELVKSIYDHVLPAVLDGGEKLSGPIQAIWGKIGPFVTKEVEKLIKDPGNGDRQAAVRTKLEDELEEQASLQQELTQLIETLKSKHGDAGISIVNSKNVIAGSITSRNLHVGDIVKKSHKSRDQVGRDKVLITNNYTNVEPLSSKIQNKIIIPDDLKAELQKLIQNGRPEQALDKLAIFSKEHSMALPHEVLALSDRWQDMAYKIRMGLISHENAVLNRNQIVNALIHIIS